MSDVFLYVDYLGTFVFAVTGASIAAKSKFDFFGMLFLAFLTAVGGGSVRDLIIEQKVFWTLDPIYLYLIFTATLSTFFMMKIYEKTGAILLFLDTLGVATFVTFGTHKTLHHGYNIETALIMGTISAVLGGILRSAFSKEYSILINRELYASVAALGSLLFILLQKLELNINLSGLIVIIFTFVFRYSAIRLKLKMPVLKDN